MQMADAAEGMVSQMDDMRPVYSQEVLALMARTDELVPAAAIAPIVKMHQSDIVHYAKTGKWDICKYIIVGKRVKFFRIDFLRNGGWI